MPDIRNAIERSYLAAGLDSSSVDALTAISTLREFEDGQLILEQFEESRDLFILLEGKAVVTSYIDEAVVATILPGSVLGEVGLIDEKTRSANVRSQGPSTAVVLDGARLRGLLDASPTIAVVILKNLSRVLCERLRKANQEVATLNVITGSY